MLLADGREECPSTRLSMGVVVGPLDEEPTCPSLGGGGGVLAHCA